MKIQNFMIAAATLFIGLGANAAQYESMGTNVAANKTATASSGTANFAVDGDTGTRWESAQTDGQWFYVDLGAIYALDQLQLDWETAYTKHFQILVSDNAEVSEAMQTELASTEAPTLWTVAAEVNEEIANANHAISYVDLKGNHGRYVAIKCLERGSVYGNSFWEFRVFSYGEYNADGAEAASRVMLQDGVEVYQNETATLSAAAINGKNMRVDASFTLTADREGVTINGMDITGNVAGTYTITATTGSVQGTANFIVRENPRLASITISADKTIGTTADTYTFSVAGKNQFGDDYAVDAKNWSVTGPSTYSIENDKLTVNGRGQYSVSLTSGDVVSNTVLIDVKAEGANLALNKDVTAIEGSNNPQNAVDGNFNTLWEMPHPAGNTDNVYDAWFTVDLGTVYDVNCIHIIFEGATSKAYRIETSEDGNQFSTLFEEPENTVSMTNREDWHSTEESKPARYVRFFSTAATTQYGTKVREFEVYTNAPLAPSELTTVTIKADKTDGHVDFTYNFTVELTDQYGKEYTASDAELAAAEWTVTDGAAMNGTSLTATGRGEYEVYYTIGGIQSNTVTISVVAEGENIAKGKETYAIEGSKDSNKAVDGEDAAGSVWEMPEPAGSTDHTYDAWIVVNLGGKTNIHAISVSWEGANSCDYKVETSMDGTSFDPYGTFSEEASVRARRDWFKGDVQAQYVRVYSTKACSGYGTKIQELEVYGDGEGAGIVNTVDMGKLHVAGNMVVFPGTMMRAAIYSTNGALMAAANGVAEMDIAKLEAGLYIVSATTAAGETITAKIVKR